MQDGTEFLRDLAKRTIASDGPTFEPNMLRFVLEKRTAGAATAKSLAELRPKLEALLLTNSFRLEPLFDQVDPEVTFFVLAFPGVKRTLPPDLLFQLASTIRIELELVSCEPDTGDRVFADPDPRTGSTTELAFIDFFCLAEGPPPADKLWALRNTRVVEAWTSVPSLGSGVRIAHIDTGITDHPDIADITMDRASALNLLEGGTDPSDPLRAGTANPGHATATGSAVASASTGQITGAAPAATLIPIRAIEDVKVFDASPIARAIEHATKVGAHVITMSLGGIGSRALEHAIANAVAQDIIVVAAAGNCVGLVVWPAAYPDVIAVGGSNFADGTWRGTSFGSKVEFSAPAEFVWVAERRTPTDQPDKVAAAQGTSFATAITAGVAALWLAKFGRAAVVAEARRRNISVQELFRAAARQTARQPAGWKTSSNGSGIINAEDLVQLPLAQIVVPPQATPGGLEAALTAVLGPGEFDTDFDWQAHGAEVSSMLIADAKVGRAPVAGRAEAKAFRLPSDGLKVVANGSRDARLSTLMRRAGTTPALVTAEPANRARTERLIRQLGKIAGTGMGLEAVDTPISTERGQDLLRQSGSKQILTPLEGRLKQLADRRLTSMVGDLAQQIDELGRRGIQTELSEVHTISLEALVELEGRPALGVHTRLDGSRAVQTVDGNSPELGGFQGLVNVVLSDIEDRCFDPVGRIDADGFHIGTGFVVGDGLVLTNRHVLQAFAAPIPGDINPDRWLMARTTTINFSPDANDPRARFFVREVLFAGPDPIIEDAIDYDKLDLALLKVDTTNASGGTFPAPIQLSSGPAASQTSTKLFVIGYPAAPARLPLDDAGRVRQDVVEALKRIYGIDYGKKFFSPGMVKQATDNWRFDHDATTLGGNSGSLVANFADLKVLGLHFAGNWLTANQAHDLSVVLARTPILRQLLI